MLAPADTRVFTVETLSVVKELTKKCWTLPYSTRVDSIANFQHTQATGDLLSVRDLVPDRKLIDRQRLAAIKNVALEEPLLVNKLVSQEGTVTAVNVTIQIPHHDYTAGTPHVVDQARAIVRDFRQRYPDIKFYLTGMAVMNNAFGEASQGDSKVDRSELWLDGDRPWDSHVECDSDGHYSRDSLLLNRDCHGLCGLHELSDYAPYCYQRHWWS